MSLTLSVVFVGCVLTQSPAMPSGTVNDWVNNQGKWKQVGAALMAKAPATVRTGNTYTKLRHLYREYVSLLKQQGAPFNSSFVGRVRYGLQKWTCGSHADNLEGLFNGANIQGLRTSMVKGRMTDSVDGFWAGVNSEHGCLFVKVEGLALAFDPWLPAFLSNKTYNNLLQDDFGGLPYQCWELVMKRYGYHEFSSLEPDTWRRRLDEALKDGEVLDSPAPAVFQPERRVDGGHWRLNRISVVKAQPNSKEDSAFAVLGTRLWSWRYELPSRALIRSQLVLSASPSLAALPPGSVSVIGRVFEQRDSGKPTSWFDLGWDPSSGFQKIYAGVDRTQFMPGSEDKAGPYQESFSVSVPVPGAVPEFRIYVTTGGLTADGGGVHYIYSWSGAGTAPEQVAKPTFQGRWDTSFGVVTLKVSGRTLTGSYPHDQGRLEGKLSLDGMTATGTWKEAPSFQPPNDAGEFEFRLAENGKAFTGSYWYGSKKPGVAGRPWNGKLIEK